MERYDPIMILWRYMELPEKKKIMFEFIKKHGDHFDRNEFFRFLAEKYDVSQIEFEADEKAAA